MRVSNRRTKIQDKERVFMEIIILSLVIVSVGLSAASLGTLGAIFLRQD